MEQYSLSYEEIKLLKKQGEKFKEWLETETGQKESDEHHEHSTYFKSNLSRENLPNMTKSRFVELYKNLWVSQFWENKDWNINQIIEKNGFDNLKYEFYQLLHGKESFEKRYDSFRKKIKGFGISAVSEILNMMYPEKYCLWNDKTKTVLEFLNFKKNLPNKHFKYNLLTGKEYSECINLLTLIKNELSPFQIKDFVDLDIFFWYVFSNIIPNDWKKGKILNEEVPNELKEKINRIDLENLILEYDKNREYFGKGKITEEEAMKIRGQFLQDFPPDKILDIELDNYIMGKKSEKNEINRKTFCYRLEYGLPGFGSVGGINSIKYGIFFSPKQDRYVYNDNKFDSPKEAYQEIITQINTLIESGKNFTKDKDWEKLSKTFEQIEVIHSVIKSKILTVYFPDMIVDINSENGTKQILKTLFKIPDKDINDEFILKKKKLWQLKENHPIMKNWSNFDYSYFVWDAWKSYLNHSEITSSVQEKEITKNELDTSFWVIRAGNMGDEKEKEILENNIVTINWYAGNLSRFTDRESLKKEFAQLNPTGKKRFIETVSSELWNFANEIKKGDIAILPQLSKGSKHDVAIGLITDVYQYREDLPKDIKNTIPLVWLHKNIPNHEFTEDAKDSFGVPLTVYRITKPPAIQSIVNTMKKYNILPQELKKLQLDGKDITPEIKVKNLSLTLENLSESLFIPLKKLKVIKELLEEKKQIIFYGPPGTSKTFVAKRFSEYFVNGKKENIEIVQFHPSYSYEDFVEGIKPRLSLEGEATGFIKQSGILKNLVDKCINKPDEKFILIIDEINRGNISKIFGELIYLLEYRNEKIRLTYSPNEDFYIPSNLYIIGTMNSADRSIAFVDYALRRRFYFIEFYPDGENENILKKWFIKNGIKESYQDSIIELLRVINIEISKKRGREYQIGYSYFMNKLDYEMIRRIIDYAIFPLIEQYFFGKEENVEEIRRICNTCLTKMTENSPQESDNTSPDSLKSFTSQA